MSNRLLLTLSVAALGAALAAPAAARTFCCTDAKGRKICGDALPEQCEDRAYKEFGGGGKVRNVEAPLTPEQKAARDAAEAQKKEDERIAAEAKRRDQALLNTYGNEKDIDLMRDRAVAEKEASGKQAQEKYEAAQKRKKALERELEFYARKPVPANLKSQIQANEAEIAAQQKALDDKQKEIEAVKAKFEDDRRRFRELKGTPAPADTARPR